MEQWEKDMDELHVAFKVGSKRRKFKKWFRENILKQWIGILALIISVLSYFKK